jgi:two-component system sensor histidine kinase HydH
MTAPMVGVSLLLLAIGILAAWYVHRLQKTNSVLLAQDVASMLAAEDLEINLREVRDQLRGFLRTGDPSFLESIPSLQEKTRRDLAEARKSARLEPEQQKIAELERGCDAFFKAVHERAHEPIEAKSPQQLYLSLQAIDDLAQKQIFAPARKYVEMHRTNVNETSEQSQRWADLMGLGLLLLGTCGSVGGLLAGFGIARGISRSIVQLSVPVRGAAGKLNEVVGPITLSAGGGFEELGQALENMADHIGTVVERLEQREREVLRGEQLAAVGQLAAGVAHELRNPLMAMKILVQAAAEREDGGGLRGRDLLVVDEEITRLERSIQSLLDFARPPQPEKFVFDVRGLLRQTVDLLSARAGKQRVELETDLPQEPVFIEADSGQIRQVLLNLLLNALDALPDGGVAYVRLSAGEFCTGRRASKVGREDLSLRGLLPSPRGQAAEDGESSFDDLALAEHGETEDASLGDDAAECVQFESERCIAIRVGDSGAGLPAELGKRIFEPFVSTKETGTGLGLSICQRIIAAHGGELTAANRREGGAEFTIRLPQPAATGAAAGRGALSSQGVV